MADHQDKESGIDPHREGVEEEIEILTDVSRTLNDVVDLLYDGNIGTAESYLVECTDRLDEFTDPEIQMTATKLYEAQAAIADGDVAHARRAVADADLRLRDEINGDALPNPWTMRTDLEYIASVISEHAIPEFEAGELDGLEDTLQAIEDRTEKYRRDAK